ncbi:MAG: TetR/AcrR family transcriptional regulator [Pseudomonadota bacterium]
MEADVVTQMMTAKSSKGEERREAIEAAARRMLLDEGYAGVSLRGIATKLGISVGNLQYYFPTKDDLVESVIVGETQKPIDLLGGIAWSPNDAPNSIRQAVGSLLQYYASEAGRFYAIMESLALHDARYAKLKADGYAHVLGHIEQLIGLVVPNLPADRAAGLARVLVALIDGASLQVQFARNEADSVDALIVDVSSAIEHLLESWE